MGGGCVKELHHATGGDHGGIAVDEEFVDLFEDVFSKRFLDVFRQENPGQWLQLTTDFERKKRLVGPTDSTSTNLPLPWALGDSYQRVMGRGVEEAFQPCRRAGVSFQSGMVCVGAELMRQLFGRVLLRIVAHLRKLLALPALQQVRYLFLVGGFSESPLLQRRLIEEFGARFTVLVPEEPSLAVVRGAVRFGHYPEAISARVAPCTYGFKRCPVFELGVHDSRRRVVVDGVARCSGVFHRLVCRGEELPRDTCHHHTVRPVSGEQTTATIMLLSAPAADVCYVDEEGVQELGQLQVKWPGRGMDRELTIDISFGDTEIYVKATTSPLGHSVATSLDFLHHK